MKTLEIKTKLIVRLNSFMNTPVNNLTFLESLSLPALTTLIDVYERQNNILPLNLSK